MLFDGNSHKFKFFSGESPPGGEKWNLKLRLFNDFFNISACSLKDLRGNCPNFFAVAGYEIIDNLGFATVDEGVEAAIKAEADIVVICSSDDEYAEYAIPAYEKLAGKALFVVAGAPACSEELKNAGIENFIHVRVNVLETLKDINAKL